jgi:transposase InsO family protein
MWQEISMDFIVDLPESNGCTNMLVVTDRLSKGVLVDALQDITAETLADWFVRTYYRRHAIPKAIVSDRGAQFVGALWKRVCQLLGITRRLSTAFHPETDGSTQRMNQNVETFLRMFVDYDQEN